ncbi:hypothetical protein EDC94DRAFT_634171 [Helicostylum pulchrum]|nr:hypothetical protein EDC94DRAFT_634171 [Helicostylum pulchrum]
MRSNVIRDVIKGYSKSTDTVNNRVSHQLREVILIVKQTLRQTFDIFFSKESDKSTLLGSYVTAFQKTFLIPSKSSHGNETPSQPAITRLFSPSSNVHLIVRYLPESIQKYLPEFDPSPALTSENVQGLIQSWLEQVQDMLKEKVPEILSSIQSQADLIQVRSKLWELLDEDENRRNSIWKETAQNLLDKPYSIWDNLFRHIFNDRFKLMIDLALAKLSNQPESFVWPLVTDPSKSQRLKKDFAVTMNIWPGANTNNQSAFGLPNFSSSEKIQMFKESLKETANDRTDTLYKSQNAFDSCLTDIRKDVETHLKHFDYDNFHIKSDTDMIKSHFQDKSYQSVLNYSTNIKTLLEKVGEWADNKKKNELSIFFGRLARNIAYLSKELPKALLLSVDTAPIFELRSSVNKDPKYTATQNELISTYHQAHNMWISWLESEFARRLRLSLSTSKWNDKCAAVSVWESKYLKKKLVYA